MNKLKIYSIIITILLVLVIIGICIYFFTFRETITEEEAKNIAIEYANVKENDINNLSISKDREDREYNIHFYDNVYEYEIDISYINGKIDNFEKDIYDNVNINDSNNINSITEDEAKNIALQRVGKSIDEVTFTRVKKDRENGITVYDIYFNDNEKGYELSIDINSKEIIVYKEDYLKLNNSNKSNSDKENSKDEYIGSQKAKGIVLEHAGLKESEVTFNKIELDVDYNIATYEIEFYHNYSEYDYEINAITGEILKYEKQK